MLFNTSTIEESSKLSKKSSNKEIHFPTFGSLTSDVEFTINCSLLEKAVEDKILEENIAKRFYEWLASHADANSKVSENYTLEVLSTVSPNIVSPTVKSKITKTKKNNHTSVSSPIPTSKNNATSDLTPSFKKINLIDRKNNVLDNEFKSPSYRKKCVSAVGSATKRIRPSTSTTTPVSSTGKISTPNRESGHNSSSTLNPYNHANVKLPDGDEPELMNIEVLSTDEIKPCDNPMAEITSILEAITSTVDEPEVSVKRWLARNTAVESFRRLALYHSDTFECYESETAVLHSIIPIVRENVENLRSALNKNGLLAFTESFKSLGSSMHYQLPKSLDIIVSKAVCDKKFLCTLANNSLESLVDGCKKPEDLLYVLQCFMVFGNSKNARVQLVGATFIDRCIKLIVSDTMYGSKEEMIDFCKKIIRKSTLEGFVIYMDSRLSTTRKSVTSSMVALASIVTIEFFESKAVELLSDKVSQKLLREVKSSLAKVSRGSKAAAVDRRRAQERIRSKRRMEMMRLKKAAANSGDINNDVFVLEVNTKIKTPSKSKSRSPTKKPRSPKSPVRIKSEDGGTVATATSVGDRTSNGKPSSIPPPTPESDHISTKGLRRSTRRKVPKLPAPDGVA